MPALSHRSIGRAVAAGTALAALALPSCLSPDPRVSLWPPADYYVEVRYSSGQREQRRVRIWADGLVLYGVAGGGVTAPDDDARWLPVFRRVCAYRLMDRSIRHLSRLLEQAGVHDQTRAEVDGGEAGGELVALHWHGWQNQRTLYARTGNDSEVVRALHVINAFLPENEPIRLDEMSGEPQPRRVDAVPDVVDSADGALQLHLSLIEEQPGNADLMVDAFALAIDLDRKEVARQLIGRVEALATSDADFWASWERGSLRGDLADQLRGFLGPSRP